MSIDVVSIIPEIIITCVGLLVLLLTVFIGKKFDKAIAPITAIGLVGGIAAIFIFNFYNTGIFFSSSFVVENFSNFFRVFILLATLIVIGLSVGYVKGSVYIKRNLGEFYFLILMVYGATGEINLEAVSKAVTEGSMLQNNYLLIIGVVMSLIGFGFKVAAAPFHFWAPDTYEGAPTIITVLITTIAKIAAFAGLIRLLYVGISDFKNSLWVILFIIAMSLLSAILGNLMALPQKNFKRLMAYSSISHAGYMLIGFAAASVLAQWAIMVYLMAYVTMNLGAFAVAMLVERSRKSEAISAFAGIGYTNPFISICMIIFMISMVGLPPFAGFIGKLFIFQAGVSSNLTWLVIIGVLTSVISLYYYVNIIKQMYFTKYEGDASQAVLKTPKLYYIIIAACALFTILMVVIPSIFINLTQSSITTAGF